MSMGAPACDVIPRTEGLLEGEGGSRGKGGRVEGRYTPTVPWHWWTPGTGGRLPLVSPAPCTGPASLSLAASSLRD